ncbi:MAG: ThuA domain-containing protein [Armatimonadetes bacterium]|nr:ThuA domain-containing protein [Armatimonadota bacterium]
MTRYLLLALITALPTVAQDAPAKLRILVATGGHDFERKPFETMWNELPGIAWREAQHPDVHRLFRPDAARDYDVLVLYDMPSAISDEAKADLVALLTAGKPLVALHHSLGGYDAWPEYWAILGGHYMLAPHRLNGIDYPASTYEHDVTFPVKVVDPKHPVTKGLADFDLLDEVYGRFWVAPNSTPLLTTTEPKSSPTLGWTHRYGRSQVVYLEPGHGPTSWNNPVYRTLLVNAIHFAYDQTITR